MNNSQMKAGRFLNWHKNRKLVAAIVENLSKGNSVILSTHTRQTKYTKKHADMFKATKTGAWVQSGKNFNCINGCKITVWH